MLCKIQSDTLTAIANQARRLTGTSALLSPAQMATALSDVSPGGGSSYDSDNNVFSFSVGSGSLGVGDYIRSDKISALTAISMPACASIEEFDFFDCTGLVSAHFPACTSLGTCAFGDDESFETRLETLTLNSACTIPEGAFYGVLAPDSKTFRLYLRGNSMGTCSDAAFYVYETDDNTNLYVDAHDKYGQTIPGLEIYVPANLLNDFKTTWAGGAFANNIYALTD